MTVSVVIPNYNHGRFLRQRIESVLNQTWKDFELIILDDYSTDESRDIIREYVSKYPNISACFNDINSGTPFSQWNKGVNLAKCEFVWIAESDDYSEFDFLERIVSEITRFKSAGLIFCDSRIVDEEKGIEYLYSDRFKNKDILRKLSIRTFVDNPTPNVSSVLFRKSAYMNAGGADASMHYCADWFLYIKILLNSEIKYFPEPLNNYRLHSDSRYHRHYSDNVFLTEKLKIFRYLMKKTKNPVLTFPALISIIKTLILRFLYLIRVPSVILPEIPRRPVNVKQLS